MFEAFNLTGIATDMARTLPNGEKNAIRKTYKGHIKKLGVNGHFDSVKRELDAEDGFMRLIHEPEDSWSARQVKSKEVERGLSDESLAALRQAMTMARGTIPKSDWDSAVLGDLASEKLSGGGKSSLSGKATTPNTPLHPGVARSKAPLPATLAQVQAQAQEAARPRRSIKKRSYGDSSFEGYGEGFPDDDGGADAGYSTGEGDERGTGQKRRKKVLSDSPPRRHVEPLADVLQNPGPAQFASGPVRQQNYGPGMVGA